MGSVIQPPREVVLASAGAGKTFRISSRLIGLLAAGVPPESILASTFTRKAAGQILDRVLHRLAEAALDADAARELAGHAALTGFQPPTSRQAWAELLAQTVRNLHRLQVGTLDAFMVGAASSFEAELGLPTGWQIGDETDIQRLISRALSELLATVDREEMLRLVRQTAPGPDSRPVHSRFVDWMRGLLAIQEELRDPGPDAWRAFRGSGPITSASDEDREHVLAAIRGIQVPKTKAGADNRHWRRAVDGLVDAVRSGDWEGFLKNALCTRVVAGDLVYSRHEIDQETCKAIQAGIEIARDLVRAKIADEVEAFGELTRLYERIYRRLQWAAKSYDFSDITRLVGTGDPLGDRADLYYRLDGRIRHILLDEFQDTSTQQWQALSPLLDEVLSDSSRAAVIVADPKQSIYGWRGAEPALVHAVGERYGLNHDHLATSWRSSQVVLDFVNRVFDGIAANPAMQADPVREEVAKAWSENFRVHRAQKDLPGYVAIEAAPDADRGSRMPLVCAHTADRIAELRETAPGYTIGVLTRTNDTVARLFMELRKRGVPVSQEGGNPLTDSAPCEAILALLKLADHPGHSLAAYHVARSPLGAVVGLVDERDDAVVHGVVRKIRTSLLSDGYGETISRLARQLAPMCDAREARRLGQLAELAHRYDSDATLRPGDFVRYVETVRVEDPAAAQVRVMTVFQAKGLEFDIVFLPELGEPAVSNRMPKVLPFRENAIGPIDAVYPCPRKDLRALFTDLDEPVRQYARAQWRDALSILYVGLTRARYATHIVTTPASLDLSGSTVTSAAIIGRALNLSVPEASIEPGVLLYEAGDRTWWNRPEARPEHGAEPAPSDTAPSLRVEIEIGGRHLRRQTPSGVHAGEVDIGNLLRITTADAMARGTIAHAWFEAIHWIEDGLPPSTELIRIANEAAPHLPDSEIHALLTDFHRWLDTPAISGALSRRRYRGVTTVERELSFLHRRRDSLMEGIIDRLVLVGENERYESAEILDFKTDRVDGPEILSRTEYYRPQLEAYLRAVSAMYGIPPERCSAALVYVEPGLVVPVGGEGEEHEPVPLVTG